MMRILNTKQIRELDAYTIQHEPIASIDLMERASRAFVDWLTMRIDPSKKIGVVCGTGNNGGDGLAIARMLHGWDYAVRLWIIRGGVPESVDFRENYRKLPQGLSKTEITAELDTLSLGDCDILIDAIFGSGLSRPPEGIYAQVIHALNQSEALRVAVDIPSGLMADSVSSGAIVKADYTVSFQLPKLAFMLPECYQYTGEWELVNIGLSKEFIRACQTSNYYLRLRDVKKRLRTRGKYDHKGTYGHALLIAGSYGKMGAAVLASRAALRSGLGLLTAHVPRCGYEILQTAVPEAMAVVDDDAHIFTGAGDLARYSALGIGPGLGQDKRTVAALEKTLETFQKPVMLDADALNILGANRHLMKLVRPGSILTPHPKEFERLAGRWKNDFDRLDMQRQLAASLKSVIVLKGAHTSIATAAGVIYFNSTGNPGMATGGTGDVLSGVLTGLLAQNYSAIEAAITGVFLHGLSGDLGAEALGMHSLTASDVIDYLPDAFSKAFK